MNKILSNISVFLLIFMAQTVSAQSEWSPVATLSVGNQWARGGETQRLFLQSDIENAYVAHRETDHLAGIELFWGFQHSLNASLLGQIGVAVAKSANTNLQGDILEDADPVFNNYSYRYKVRHSHMAVKGLLLMPIQYGLLPYVSASLGVGSNEAYDFTSTPKIEEETPVPASNNNTKTSFTYTLGIGLRKIINQHWQVGASYEFADWGKSQLSQAPGQTINTGLKLNHLYTQGVYIDLSYIFDT